jgi:hypothetical protein
MPETAPTVEDYFAAEERARFIETERRRLGAIRPLTIGEAARVLASLRRLVWLTMKGEG